MRTNDFYFAIVVNNKVTKSFKMHADNYMELASGMMCVERMYHTTASMYVYQYDNEQQQYTLIHKMDAKSTTIMPESFDVNAEPFTLNHIINTIIY